MTDYFTNVVKIPVPPRPQLPQLGVMVKFYDKDFRDKFYDLLQEAKKAAHWTVPFKRPDQHMS